MRGLLDWTWNFFFTWHCNSKNSPIVTEKIPLPSPNVSTYIFNLGFHVRSPSLRTILKFSCTSTCWNSYYRVFFYTTHFSPTSSSQPTNPKKESPPQLAIPSSQTRVISSVVIISNFLNWFLHRPANVRRCTWSYTRGRGRVKKTNFERPSTASKLNPRKCSFQFEHVYYARNGKHNLVITIELVYIKTHPL